MTFGRSTVSVLPINRPVTAQDPTFQRNMNGFDVAAQNTLYSFVFPVSTGNNGMLGWYSQAGQGEIGDLPVNACNGDLSLVFKEVQVASGGGIVPIQLMWSNADDGPAASTG